MSENRTVKNRGVQFANKTTTRIWEEQSNSANPYIADVCRCHGYDLHDLMQNCSYTDVLYLLFRGELPTVEQAELLQQLMIVLINPGPRHPATRAAMATGIGKTDITHILPISLSVMGGRHDGAGSLEEEIRFFKIFKKCDPVQYWQKVHTSTSRPEHGDWRPVPGFGSNYGGIDTFSVKTAERLVQLPAAGEALQWGHQLSASMATEGLGWLMTGVAAATFCDLGFTPQTGIGLFQILSSPGLFAHGLEMSNKPISAMPFISDNNYIIEEK